MSSRVAENLLVFCEDGNATELAERVLARIFEAERKLELMSECAPSHAAAALHVQGPTRAPREVR